MLDKTYSPKDIEQKHYDNWEKKNAFCPNEDDNNGKTFAVMMPPPNVTGNLHMGHALNYTLQDVLVRYHRMRGYKTLWQPGADHAGIATQMVVEKMLAKDGLPGRREMGREKFLEHVWEWKEKYGGAIVNQQKKLGLTPDWSRQRFTMDEGLSDAVKKVFVKLYNDGLIYKAKRLVNWDPKLLTAVSDLEVINTETNGNFWYIKYELDGKPGKFITVATTRPETLLGDTGIAVNPEDARYKDLIGTYAIVPFVNRKILIVADEHSDPEKGTGAVKITPAHDFNDFEVGQRHNLEQITVLDEHGNMTADMTPGMPQQFAGQDRFKARKLIVAELEKMGRIDKVEQTTHSVPHGERSGVVLEPRITEQWFVNTEPLAEKALAAVIKKQTNIMPESQYNTYKHWMNNIQPWCISRQLWWGHQIPAWYGSDGTIFVAENQEEAQAQADAHYGKQEIITQDEDVLDTWFSSALWPFSTLGWPEKTAELKDYYPTSCLITGTDLIFFWIARMMMMGIYIMDDVPFKDVFLHALVRDENGQKMSKSKGNVVDPLTVIDIYGTDALRFTMTAFAAPGRDIKYSDKLVEGYRNFATKLWNAARFLEHNKVSYKESFDPKSVKLELNKWIISEVTTCLINVENSISKYRFDEAASFVYRFAWGTFCDWYIEFTKPILNGDSAAEITETKETLGWVFGQLLHILHPMMPFITEELWQNLTSSDSMLITSKWPLEQEDRNDLINSDTASKFNWIIDIITTIRSVRTEVNVPAGSKIKASMVLDSTTDAKTIKEMEPLLLRLARV